MQLTLFTGHTSPSLRADLKKRPRKKGNPAKANAPRWDLWTQETEEEEKEMALFFLDIRNFTPFVEAHVAGDVIHIVRKLFSSFQHIIRVHHGRIIETSGDGFYAAFGFDRGIKEAVNAAVQAGQAIMATLDMLNEGAFRKELQHKIEIGIGLHAGKVATGRIRLGSEDHLMVMGYPVNIAARLQSATRELNNSFIVSSAVFHLLQNPPHDRPATDMRLKGVTEPCRLHLIGKPYTQCA